MINIVRCITLPLRHQGCCYHWSYVRMIEMIVEMILKLSLKATKQVISILSQLRIDFLMLFIMKTCRGLQSM